MTFASLGTSAAPFPPRPPLGLLSLEKATNAMNFFIMEQSLSLCLLWY
jgi:hypothetical protein